MPGPTQPRKERDWNWVWWVIVPSWLGISAWLSGDERIQAALVFFALMLLLNVVTAATGNPYGKGSGRL